MSEEHNYNINFNQQNKKFLSNISYLRSFGQKVNNSFNINTYLLIF